MDHAISLQVFTFNIFQENTYILFNQNKEAIVIDPGCTTATEQEQLACFIQHHELSIQYLLNTHAHIDHIIGNDYIANTYGVPLYMHQEGLVLLDYAVSFQEHYGFAGYQKRLPDFFLSEGDRIGIEGCSLLVIHVPGHAPGHVAFYSEALKICFVGDTLFKGNIGRTDLLGGSRSLLLKSIRTKLFGLPNDVAVYSGHGEPTTIGMEKNNVT